MHWCYKIYNEFCVKRSTISRRQDGIHSFIQCLSLRHPLFHPSHFIQMLWFYFYFFFSKEAIFYIDTYPLNYKPINKQTCRCTHTFTHSRLIPICIVTIFKKSPFLDVKYHNSNKNANCSSNMYVCMRGKHTSKT